ncbi:hypothetical protein AB0D66_26945 [Streptomyces sp. NPDC048270]|uniref:hypothetical protein n=1 Tax=Streptomyces sp. NPDC048270 TaxID=3154615 RepID=UPI0033D5152D
MTDYNWWVSEEKASYSEALRDARGNGDGFVVAPHFEPKWEGSRLVDFERHLPMVDWDLFRRFLKGGELTDGDYWFFQMESTDAMNMGLKVNERLHLRLVEGAPEVHKAITRTLMGYIVTGAE